MSSPRFALSSHSQSFSPSGYGYRECSCCPYGFHIDLDFVRYCESILSQETDRTGSIKRRKDRRRQRHSMEVLLGISQPVLCTYDQCSKALDKDGKEGVYNIDKQNEEISKKKFMYILQNDFAAAVSDFEKILKPIQPAPSTSSYAIMANETQKASSSPPTPTISRPKPTCKTEKSRDSGGPSMETFGPLALQKIREQMALSLERTRQLENQVTIIPRLEEQVSNLKEENTWLLSKLKDYETNKKGLKSETTGSASPVENPISREKLPVQQKDFGVMCSVLTRNVGVGNQVQNTKSVSTATVCDGTEFADKWYDHKLKFLTSHQSNSVPQLQKLNNIVSTGTQTVVTREKRNVAIQTTNQVVAVKKTFDCPSQTDETNCKVMLNKSIGASPDRRDFTVQNNPLMATKGVSDDTVDRVHCEKCSVAKTSTAVGPDLTEDSHTVPVSLAALSFPRSKSFNLGTDKLTLSKRSRSVSCQYDKLLVSNFSKSSQTEFKNSVKTTQTSIKTSARGTQHEHQAAAVGTDTRGLVVSKHVACETKKIEIQDASCEAKEIQLTTSSEKSTCAKCSTLEKEKEKEKEDYIKKEGGSPTPSRIPRPQLPTTPIENRKFKRQDTYTVSTFPTEKNMPTSPKSPTKHNLEYGLENSALHKAKSIQAVGKTTIEENSIIKSGASSGIIENQEAAMPAFKTVALSSLENLNRKKAEPSSEMRGAMKVLNDALQKTHTKHVVNSRAVDIVRDEWFKVSSHATANPLHVEDYLDCFEEMSSNLLEYIVNMNDSSGNTAMHYAVSHGNFDVVSILLDSKVCDINRPNKAGYTSVMLVSLAQIKSPAHVCVVKRLFHLADVNIKAKEHGQTALMLAVSHGRLDMVRMLIEAAADINIQDDDGSTALMCAAEHGHIEIVKYFLSQPECDTTITDVDGSTALKIAMEANHRHIGVLLYAHERNLQMTQSHGSKMKKSKTGSPKPNSSPLPVRSNQSSSCALPDPKSAK